MQDTKDTLNSIDQNTEMALLQGEKIAKSVDNLEPIMEGVLLKTDEVVQELKKKQIGPKLNISCSEVVTLRGKDGKDGEKGEKGDRGERGEKGDKGEKGEPGRDGIDGMPGNNGFDGKNGMPGLPGKPGKDGKDGKDGRDGSPDTAQQVKDKLLEIGIEYDEINNTPDIEKIVLAMQSSKTYSLSEMDDVVITNPQTGDAIKWNPTTNKWENGTVGFTNPMTTEGDLIYGTTGGDPERLGIGEEGQVLTVQSGLPVWDYPEQTGNLIFMFANTASDIATYYDAVILPNYTVGALGTISTAGVSTTPTLLGSFATELGYPGVTNIPEGIWHIHYETEKVAGSNNYYTYAEVYKRNLGGTETLLFTSDSSTESASNNQISHNVVGITTAITVISPSDRIVVKVYGVMLSSTATIKLYFDDNTDSRLEMPSVAVDASNFVPYTGATGDVNLGTHGLTTSGGDFVRADNTFESKITPEVGMMTRYHQSEDLFDLGTIIGPGYEIQGSGHQYKKSTNEWFFQKVSNDTNVGGTHVSSMGYINLTTGAEAYVEVSEDSTYSAVTSDGDDPVGWKVTEAGGMDIQGKDASALTRMVAFRSNDADLGNGAIVASIYNNGDAVFKSTGVTGRLVTNSVALTDGANVAVDSSLANTFTLTAAGNRTIDAPTNPVNGQRITIYHKASGADRTLTLASGAGGFIFGTDITALTATASGLTDLIGCEYNSSADRWMVCAYVKGFNL